jgi:hypothetical protein
MNMLNFGYKNNMNEIKKQKIKPFKDLWVYKSNIKWNHSQQKIELFIPICQSMPKFSFQLRNLRKRAQNCQSTQKNISR